MKKYFAYGSNCNPEVLERKNVSVTSRRRAVLRGYRLLFNKKSLRERLPENIGFANINELPEGVVEGILYELSTESDLERLDTSERYPTHYTRIRVVVEADGVKEQCWAYQAQPEMTADGLVPTRNYLNHILAGREFLSTQYLEALNQSQTYVCDCACCHRTGEALFVKEVDRLHTLCQSCREARLTWSDAFGRVLTISETESVMTRLVLRGPGFQSIGDLVAAAVERKLLER